MRNYAFENLKMEAGDGEILGRRHKPSYILYKSNFLKKLGPLNLNVNPLFKNKVKLMSWDCWNKFIYEKEK